MNIYPENEIIKAAELYACPEFDSISFERKRIKNLLKYLDVKGLCYNNISCCQCTPTKSLYHFTYEGQDYFVWGENSHPLSKRIYFSFKITS